LIPYVFVPTKEQIAAYASRTGPVACIVIPEPGDDDDYKEDYREIVAEIRALAQE
jgi:hypothetical protein